MQSGDNLQKTVARFDNIKTADKVPQWHSIHPSLFCNDLRLQ